MHVVTRRLGHDAIDPRLEPRVLQRGQPAGLDVTVDAEHRREASGQMQIGRAAAHTLGKQIDQFHDR